ncbi:MAG: AEC family transporter, partial [Flavobacterium sp.]
MNNFILIFIFLFLGLALQRIKQIPKNAHKILNWIVIYFCLPALALDHIPKIKWDNKLLFPIGVAWIGFIFSFFFFRFLGKRFGWSRKLTGCLIICAGLSNTSFLGFPIIEALYGEEGLKTAILVDQPGTFLVLSTLAVFVATVYSKGNLNNFQIVKKIAFFPPFITFCIACLMNVLQFNFYEWLQLLFKSMGSLVTPLALLSVGFQLRFEKQSMHWGFLRLGLFYKLILTPAIIYFLYVIVL